MHFSPSRLVIAFTLFIACSFFYTINSISARDPTSVFFNPGKGYAPRYSAIRRKQAEAFVEGYNPATVVKSSTDEKKRKLCIGIPSFNRPGAQYLPDAVGSLLEGLTPEERQEIYFIVFIPHSKPEAHPAYHEEWLAGLTDQVLTYGYGFDRMQYIRDLERTNNFEEKGLFDYTYLLNACKEQYTPYIAMFEDDTVAIDGWYHRTMAAVHDAEQQAALQRAKPHFLYLRLFYTEEFLGWNSEDWRTYLANSIYVATIPAVLLILVRFAQPTTKLSLALLTRRTFIATYATLAALILIFFGLGRVTVLPMPVGVHEMPQFGCCSQAFVFPNVKAGELVEYFKERHVGYADVLTEDFANERGELRYAVTPSVVQHVGRSTGNGPWNQWGMRADKIWSFAFEKFDWRALRREHDDVARLRRENERTAAGDGMGAWDLRQGRA
ncbi:integral membrane [Pyrenophora seminiperda CCB06]|uniref:Integral membrane n=1 Tax=Pyrenophora seminiperda CCB06 TaxID=1302712 RepID=A0A3M7M516_9PLEO|nr:integral membrane [Pyrenophora seminiperda CCB06]